MIFVFDVDVDVDVDLMSIWCRFGVDFYFNKDLLDFCCSLNEYDLNLFQWFQWFEFDFDFDLEGRYGMWFSKGRAKRYVFGSSKIELQ